MATVSEFDKLNLIQTTFRRASLTNADGVEQISVNRIPIILGQIGQPYDRDELDRCIKRLDPGKTGYLNKACYKELCKEFVKDPAALAKHEGDDFSFKQLISSQDFRD